MSEEHDEGNASLGRMMLLWTVFIAFGVWALDAWLDKRYNPNSRLSVSDGGELRLQANQFHQYMVEGTINNVPVLFLLDTGASHVAVPHTVAKLAKLPAQGDMRVSTANGDVTVQRSTLDTVSIAGFDLQRIEGSINHYMDDNMVLLGMSALKHFDISQQGDVLILRAKY